MEKIVSGRADHSARRQESSPSPIAHAPRADELFDIEVIHVGFPEIVGRFTQCGVVRFQEFGLRYTPNGPAWAPSMRPVVSPVLVPGLSDFAQVGVLIELIAGL